MHGPRLADSWGLPRGCDGSSRASTRAGQRLPALWALLAQQGSVDCGRDVLLRLAGWDLPP